MKYLKILLIVLSFSIFTNCEKGEKESSGPISVWNNIYPVSVSSGGSITWEIWVTNSGGEVEIERIHVREEFISGWAQGQGTVEEDLSISSISVNAHASEVVYSVTTPVYNTGNTDIVAQNTITVYSSGGTASSNAVYTILMDGSLKQMPELQIAKSLLIENSLK